MITAERLREVIHYDPETGIFTRLKCYQRPDVIGQKIVNHNGNGYFRITIDSHREYLHRLAWLYMTGEYPSLIDHINGNRADNRWINLRQASAKINQQNFRHARIDSKSGLLGVSWDQAREKWVARIKIGESYKFLGRFDSAEVASDAYITAKRIHHPGCTI